MQRLPKYILTSWQSHHGTKEYKHSEHLHGDTVVKDNLHWRETDMLMRLIQVKNNSDDKEKTENKKTCCRMIFSSSLSESLWRWYRTGENPALIYSFSSQNQELRIRTLTMHTKNANMKTHDTIFRPFCICLVIIFAESNVSKTDHILLLFPGSL